MRIFIATIILTFSLNAYCSKDEYTIEVPLELGTSALTSQEDKENYIKDILAIFNEKLGRYCETVNRRLIEEGLKPCDENYCLTYYIYGNTPNEFHTSFTAGKHQWFGYYASVTFTLAWKGNSKPSARICAHPSLTSVSMEFERSLKRKIIQKKVKK